MATRGASRAHGAVMAAIKRGYLARIPDISSDTQERFQMYISEPLLKTLKALAARTDVSIAEHIRRAIETYLKKQ